MARPVGGTGFGGGGLGGVVAAAAALAGAVPVAARAPARAPVRSPVRVPVRSPARAPVRSLARALAPPAVLVSRAAFLAALDRRVFLAALDRAAFLAAVGRVGLFVADDRLRAGRVAGRLDFPFLVFAASSGVASTATVSSSRSTSELTNFLQETATAVVVRAVSPEVWREVFQAVAALSVVA